MVAKNPNNEKKSTKWSNPIRGTTPELKKGSESQTISKFATPEAKKAKRSERKRKDTDKEKKLPKKYKKGW